MRRPSGNLPRAPRLMRSAQSAEARRARMMYRMLDLGFTLAAANRLLFGPRENPQGSVQ